MDPHNSARFLIEALETVCAESGLTMTRLSHDWVIEIASPSSRFLILGYRFPLNSATAQSVADDKAATSDVLGLHGVPRVEHRIFFNGAAARWSGLEENWTSMQAYAGANGWDVVCKPSEGTGGSAVTRVRHQLELEDASRRLMSSHHAMVMSPYLEITNEYRVLLLDRQPEILYAKRRPTVIGDGSSSVATLALRQLPSWSGSLPVATAGSVPAAGESVVLEWRHNLGLGSLPEDLDPGDHPRVVSLAIDAIDALGLRVGAVDVVAVGGDLLVLEVNAGIMLEHYAAVSPAHAERGRSFYRKIVAAMLEDAAAV